MSELDLLERYHDGELTHEDQKRFAEWLAADVEHVRQFVREAHLHRQIREAMLAHPYQVFGKSELSSTEKGKATRGHQYPMRWRELPTKRTVSVQTLKWAERNPVPWFKWLRVRGFRPNLQGVQKPALVLALACLAAVIAFLVIQNTSSGPTVTLADAKTGNLQLTRAGRILNIRTATLRPGDLLSTASNSSAIITYNREPTRLRVGSKTEIAVLDSSKGKHFGLHHGRIDATVGHQPPGKPMIWQTPQAVVRVVGTEFALQAQESSTTLQVIEGKVNLTAVDTLGSIQLTNGQYCTCLAGIKGVLPKSFPGGRGTVLRECWTNLEGFHVGDLTSNAHYPDRADITEYRPALAGPAHWGSNYGERLRGYLYPPVTGHYQFWICGTDSAQLWLSSDESARKLQMIASVNLPVSPGEWEKYPWQQSYPIKLEAGRKYYIEVLHKAGDGVNDHCSVAWRIPSRNRDIIQGEFLSPVIFDPEVR